MKVFEVLTYDKEKRDIFSRFDLVYWRRNGTYCCPKHIILTIWIYYDII